MSDPVTQQREAVEELTAILANLDAIALRIEDHAASLVVGTATADAHAFVRAAHAKLGEVYEKENDVLVRLLVPEPECGFTFAHTRHWCGYATCRES